MFLKKKNVKTFLRSLRALLAQHCPSRCETPQPARKLADLAREPQAGAPAESVPGPTWKTKIRVCALGTGGWAAPGGSKEAKQLSPESVTVLVTDAPQLTGENVVAPKPKTRILERWRCRSGAGHQREKHGTEDASRKGSIVQKSANGHRAWEE